MAETELNHKGVLATLHLQLTHLHSRNLGYFESFKDLMEQIQCVTGLNKALQDNNADIQLRVEQLAANSCLVFSTFEQLQITVDSVTASTNRAHITEHNQSDN